MQITAYFAHPDCVVFQVWKGNTLLQDWLPTPEAAQAWINNQMEDA